MNELLQQPSAIAATMAALFILYLVLDKVAVPLLKARLAHNGKLPAAGHAAMKNGEFRCQRLRFEKRISTLEADHRNTAADVAALTGKLDTCIGGLAEISQKTAIIFERIEYMHNNRRKRNGDSEP